MSWGNERSERARARWAGGAGGRRGAGGRGGEDGCEFEGGAYRVPRRPARFVDEGAARRLQLRPRRVRLGDVARPRPQPDELEPALRLPEHHPHLGHALLARSRVPAHQPPAAAQLRRAREAAGRAAHPPKFGREGEPTRPRAGDARVRTPALRKEPLPMLVVPEKKFLS